MVNPDHLITNHKSAIIVGGAMNEGVTSIGRPTGESPLMKRTIWNRIAAVIDSMSVALGSFAGYFMLIASIFVCLEVLLRSVFKAPTIWVYDISCYLLIWFGFCASAYGIKRGSHINVDLLVIHMKPRTKVPLDIISHFLCLIYAGILFVYSAKMCLMHFLAGQIAPTAWGFPVWLIELPTVCPAVLLPFRHWTARCRRPQ